GLREGLNLEQGGEVAANLDSLYEYMATRLVDANVQNEIAPLDEVAGLLRNVKAGWDAIAE
ncbi:MAG: flagellar export chaperone FliS, partial [Pseudomonas sp.]|nr:flagellar export chaperone FliS [Pseudomonas sp.]